MEPVVTYLKILSCLDSKQSPSEDKSETLLHEPIYSTNVAIKCYILKYISQDRSESQ
jgi:hypothetical protein